MDKKELLLELENLKKELKENLSAEAKQQIGTEIEKLQKQLKELEEKLGKTGTIEPETKKSIEEVKTALDDLNKKEEARVVREEKNQEALDNLIAKSQRVAIPDKKEARTFNEVIGDAIEKNVDKIKNMPHQMGSSVIDITIDLMPELKQEGSTKREVKTVGDMSISANFSGATALYQDVRPLIQNPYDNVWLADILPAGTSNGTQLTYPKENGGEGGAALWEDPTADKPQMDFDLIPVNVPFKWIAGIVIIERSMLDDIPFMLSYIQNKMLISLKTAENAFILNGASVSPTVDGLNDVATAYSGSYTALVDKIIDAAYGQIVEDTEQFYRGNTVVMMPRAAVSIGLNQASGSGEYDLPAGSASFATGLLQLAGLQTVTATSIGSGNWLAFDKSATMFIRRMVPELRIFEDSTLAKKNKIMFRIEERATLAIFNNDAIVSGTTGSGS